MSFRSNSKGGRMTAIFLALTCAVLMAVPAFATYNHGRCMHTYGFSTTYTPGYDADGGVTGQHLVRTVCSFCGMVNVNLPCEDPNYGQDPHTAVLKSGACLYQLPVLSHIP